MHPINKLFTKNTPFHWTEECDEALSSIRKILKSAPILEPLPEPNIPLNLAVDSSTFGMGAVLFYLDGKGKKHYIDFPSKSLNKTQQRYPSYKLELLALLWGLNRYRDLLIGKRFHVWTDHRPLVWALTAKELPASILRWLDEIKPFDFTITYIPGINNVLPDYQPSSTGSHLGSFCDKFRNGKLKLKTFIMRVL